MEVEAIEWSIRDSGSLRVGLATSGSGLGDILEGRDCETVGVEWIWIGMDVS